MSEEVFGYKAELARLRAERDELRSLLGLHKQTIDNLQAQRDQLAQACKLAMGQLEGLKPQGGVHASSLRADKEIIRAAIASVR